MSAPAKSDSESPQAPKSSGVTDNILFLAIVLVVLFYPLIVRLWACVLPPSSKNQMETMGQFGDQYGALNAMFTGVGFILVLRTLRAQQRANAIQEDTLNQEHRRITEEAADRQKEFDRRMAELDQASLPALIPCEIRHNNNHDGNLHLCLKNMGGLVYGLQRIDAFPAETQFRCYKTDAHDSGETPGLLEDLGVLQVCIPNQAVERQTTLRLSVEFRTLKHRLRRLDLVYTRPAPQGVFTLESSEIPPPGGQS